MADDYIKGVPLADLPETTSAGDNDIMVIQNTTKTQKIKWSTIFSLIKQKLGLSTVATSGKYSDLSDAPGSLKNPHPLKFTGGVNDSYDGSQEKSVAIQTQTGDTKDNIVTFVSGDALNPDKWTDFNVIASKESHATLLNKISTASKNARYLFKILGSTDISGISGGTVTGAISNLDKARNGIEVADWDVAVESGVYYSTGSAKNAPISISEQFYGSVTAYNGSVIQEVYTTAPRVSDGGGTPAKWIRFKYRGGAWQPWQNGTLADRLLKKDIVNNATTTEEGYALDARMGKAIQDQVDELNSKIGFAIEQFSGTFDKKSNPQTFNYGKTLPGKVGLLTIMVNNSQLEWPQGHITAVGTTNTGISVWRDSIGSYAGSAVTFWVIYPSS